MLTEVLSWIRQRKNHTDFGMELVRQAAGNKHRKDWTTPYPQTENHAHEWVTNMVPNLVNGNPVIANIRSGSLPNDAQPLSDLRMAGNCWSQSANMQAMLLDFALDMQFNFACALVSTEIVPLEPGRSIDMDEVVKSGGEGYGLKPCLHRISPWRFFKDTQGISRTGPAGIGHIAIENKDDLAKEKLPNGKPRYSKAALASLGVDDGVRELLREIGVDIGASNGNIDRDQVVMYQFYSPEDGMVYTLAHTPSGSGGKKNGAYLCDPVLYRGLRSGPYVMGGIYSLPDQTYPLAPLSVLHDLSLEINRHRAQMSDDAGRAKALLIVDGDPQQVGKIQSAMNGSILCLPGFKGAATEVKTGSVDPGQAAYVAMLNEIMQGTTGLTANSSGENTGSTATEADVIQRNRNGRVKFCQDRFKEFTTRIFRVVLEQCWNNPKVHIDVNFTDPITGETTGPQMGPNGKIQRTIYVGGDGKKYGIPFDALHLEIDPVPMDDALRAQQHQQAAEFLTVNAQAMVLNPQINWANLAGDLFDAQGRKGAAKRYLDGDMLKKMQMMAQPQLFMPMGQPGMVGPDGQPIQQGVPTGAPGGAVSGPAPAGPTPPSPVASNAQKRAAPLKLAG